MGLVDNVACARLLGIIQTFTPLHAVFMEYKIPRFQSKVCNYGIPVSYFCDFMVHLALN